MEAIIFATGFGNGLGNVTKNKPTNKPKALMELDGRALLEHNICYLKSYGVKRLIINVHDLADQIINYLHNNKGFGLPYIISWERLKPLGTGGALQKAHLLFTESQDFITMNANILTDVDLESMYSFHKKQQNLITILVGNSPITKIGLCFNDLGDLVGWKDCQNEEDFELKDGRHRNFFPFWGITICQFAIFQKIQQLANSRQSLGDSYSLLDLWFALLRQGQDRIRGYVVPK